LPEIVANVIHRGRIADRRESFQLGADVADGRCFKISLIMLDFSFALTARRATDRMHFDMTWPTVS